MISNFFCISVCLLHVGDQDVNNVGCLGGFSNFHHFVALSLSLFPSCTSFPEADYDIYPRVLHVGRLSAPLNTEADNCDSLILLMRQLHLNCKPFTCGNL